jgi:hypothetical protein
MAPSPTESLFDLLHQPGVESPRTVLRVNFHERDRNRLVLDAVRPIHEHLIRPARAALLLKREWRAGPTVACMLVAADRATLDPLAEAAHGLLEDYLLQNPSTATVNAEAARSQAAFMAHWEAADQPFTYLKLDNTVTREDGTDWFRFLPGGASSALAFRFQVLTTPLVLALLHECRGQRDRLFLRAWLMCLAYGRAVAGLPAGYFFARTYWEKAAAALPQSVDESRRRFEEAYRDRRELLLDWLDRFLATPDDPGVVDPVLPSWIAIVEGLLGAARGCLDTGAELVVGDDVALDVYSTAGWDSAKVMARTPFLRHFGTNPSLRHALHHDSRMRSHVFAVNQVYGLLLTLGLSGSEKMLLLFFMARAVEERFGLDPLELVQRQEVAA